MVTALLISLGLFTTVADESVVPPKPEVVPASAWDSQPQEIEEEHRHTPSRVTLHHAGELWKDSDDPIRKVKGLQSWGQRERDWPDVPYHFLIAPDGRIIEGRSVEYKGETNTTYDTTGHLLIMCWGNFEEQRITEHQLDSAVRLAAHLIGKYDIDPSSTVGHNDVAQTACPGKDFDRYIDDGTFEQWVRDVLDGRELEIELKEPLEGGPTEFPTTQPGGSESGRE